jgi:chromosome segregation ATPase
LGRTLAELQAAHERAREQLKAARAEADALRERLGRAKARARSAKAESREAIAALEAQVEAGGLRSQGLAEELAAAERARGQVADLEAQRSALVGQIETKSSIIQSYESQVRSLREAADGGRLRGLELEVSQLQRKLATAAVQIEDLQTANQKLIGTNADLDDRVAELQAENKALSQTSQVKASLASTLRDENAELSLKLSELEESHAAQADVRLLERQNRRLAAQLQEAELEAARRDAELARLQRSPRRGEVEAAVGRIEAALEQFEVAQTRRPETVLARLEAILLAILEIAALFEEQKRSLSRIAGSLPRGIPGSPR